MTSSFGTAATETSTTMPPLGPVGAAWLARERALDVSTSPGTATTTAATPAASAADASAVAPAEEAPLEISLGADAEWRPDDPEHPPLWVILPSEHGDAQIETLLNLSHTADALGRVLLTVNPKYGNIPRARNGGLEEIRSIYRASGLVAPDPLWVLWVDSDVRLQGIQHEAIAHYMVRAEAERQAFTANYNMFSERGIESTMMRYRAVSKRASHYPLAEIQAMDDWEWLPGMCGFGFLYLPQPMHYVFRADTIGEDVHFWMDHADMPLRLAKGIRAHHLKSACI